ncbi:ABC transporter ATP-binding protein [Lysinibacter sp. HNR]|uniref:ABC transporter ATP-binding protein n=1 Tax=Lysinibacter sp. HNR TaxID=3031408 RepID=UPI0024355118|nr:ABC transporter ATP-binding protein [Lysinibacter sp. HNR]WGD38457.1 ABC transporter ATP-binding protein [Lysinibacter sp. HNR]
MTQPTVSASRLTKRFGEREVISAVSFSVTRGRAFGLLGPNGAGKTTIIRLLNGLLTPDGGAVTLFGERVNARNADALRQRIGVQTDTNLYDTLSARENLRTWGALYGIEQRSLRSRVDEILHTFGLTRRADSLVGEFSKGMRQKLAIGRAIIHKPDLLFLDEPTAGLDPEAASELIGYLRKMIQTLDTTLVISTHQLAGLEALCDDIGIIKQGHLLAAGPVDEMLRQEWPGNRYTLSVNGDYDVAHRIVTSFATADKTAGSEIVFHTDDEQTISQVVAALVHEGVGVRAVIPQHPTIEEFYFTTLDKEANV